MNRYKQDVLIEVKGKVDKNAELKAEAAAEAGMIILTVGKLPRGNSNKEILEDLGRMRYQYGGNAYKLYAGKRKCWEINNDCYWFDNQPYNCNKYQNWRNQLNNGYCPYKYHGAWFLWAKLNDDPRKWGNPKKIFQPVIGVWHTDANRQDGNPTLTPEGYRRALQARFEHGEHGYQKYYIDIEEE